MTHPLLGAAYEVHPDSGRMINSNFRRLAELVNEYNPDMYLTWIPPENRGPEDTHPFAVIHEPMGREPYVIFHLREDQLGDDIIARIYAGDQGKHDVFGQMQLHNATIAAMQEKKRQDEMDAARDLAASIIRSPKHQYRHNGRVYE